MESGGYDKGNTGGLLIVVGWRMPNGLARRRLVSHDWTRCPDCAREMLFFTLAKGIVASWFSLGLAYIRKNDLSGKTGMRIA